MATVNPNVYIQIVSCIIGSLGFALWFRIKGKQIVYSGIGALICWLTYLLVYESTESPFISTMLAAMFVAAYANIMARVNKAPTTIFLIASALPLIPGAHMYYMMYSMVIGDNAMAMSEARLMLLPCLGIAVGFIVVEIINKYALLGWKLITSRK